jgi:hypothetical protein
MTILVWGIQIYLLQVLQQFLERHKQGAMETYNALDWLFASLPFLCKSANFFNNHVDDLSERYLHHIYSSNPQDDKREQ